MSKRTVHGGLSEHEQADNNTRGRKIGERQMAEKIILALLASGNVFLFVKFLIERLDRRHAQPVEERLAKLEKDGLRMQLLFFITLIPNEQTEILKIAEYYFGTLNGDWYMTSIFNKWLTDNNIAEPEWFRKGN